MKTLNLNLSKIQFSATLFLSLVLFLSCNASNENDKQIKLTESEMSDIMKLHIILDDSNYVIDISKEDAYKAGVTNAFYDSLLVNISRGNKMIEETLKAKDAVVSLVDMQNDSIIVIRKGNQ